MTRVKSTFEVVSSRGFSLVELLVVLLIIGLGVSFVSINVGDNSSLQLRVEAKALANSIALMSEEAVMSNQQWGVDFYRDTVDSEERFGYRWLVRNEAGLWLEGNSDVREVDVLLPEGLGLRLELDALGQEQTIEYKQPISEPVQGKQNVIDEDEIADTNQVTPDIWLLSSGEMNIFSLWIQENNNPDAKVLVSGDELGRVTVVTNDEQDNE